MTRRQAMAALTAAAAAPLGCGGSRPLAPSPSGTEADAEALLVDIGARLVRLTPEAGTSLGIDTGARAELRSQLTDRSAEGQARIADQLRRDLERANLVDADHRIETAVDAGAYLARMESYARQLDGELERIQEARARGLVPPAFLLETAIGQLELSIASARAGGTLVESIESRTRGIPGSWAERARAIAATEVAPAYS